MNLSDDNDVANPNDLRLYRWFCGNVTFSSEEEDVAFRFGMLVATLYIALAALFGFVLIDLAGLSLLDRVTNAICLVCGGLAGFLLVLLRGRKDRFRFVAPATVFLVAVVVYSGFIFVPQDDLRLMWFVVLVQVCYLLLGVPAGIVSTLSSLLIVFVANPFLISPLPTESLVTFANSFCVANLFICALAIRMNHYFSRISKSHQSLAEAARRDSLTRLLTFRAWNEFTELRLREARRDRHSVSVTFIDVDHFKTVNDRFGHAVGDHVLVAVARCVESQLRQGDVLARAGGEEFVALLPDTDLDQAHFLAERIRDAVARISFKEFVPELSVTASLGVSTFHSIEEPVRHVLDRADQAMYQAKASGRNMVVREHATVLGGQVKNRK